MRHHQTHKTDTATHCDASAHTQRQTQQQNAPPTLRVKPQGTRTVLTQTQGIQIAAAT